MLRRRQEASKKGKHLEAELKRMQDKRGALVVQLKHVASMIAGSAAAPSPRQPQSAWGMHGGGGLHEIEEGEVANSAGGRKSAGGAGGRGLGW